MSRGLAIDISGKDEISEFGESMKGVRAAIVEKLLHVAQMLVPSGEQGRLRFRGE